MDVRDLWLVRDPVNRGRDLRPPAPARALGTSEVLTVISRAETVLYPHTCQCFRRGGWPAGNAFVHFHQGTASHTAANRQNDYSNSLILMVKTEMIMIQEMRAAIFDLDG